MKNKKMPQLSDEEVLMKKNLLGRKVKLIHKKQSFFPPASLFFFFFRFKKIFLDLPPQMLLKILRKSVNSVVKNLELSERSLESS